jgi:hypothetical protein
MRRDKALSPVNASTSGPKKASAVHSCPALESGLRRPPHLVARTRRSRARVLTEHLVGLCVDLVHGHGSKMAPFRFIECLSAQKLSHPGHLRTQPFYTGPEAWDQRPSGRTRPGWPYPRGGLNLRKERGGHVGRTRRSLPLGMEESRMDRADLASGEDNSWPGVRVVQLERLLHNRMLSEAGATCDSDRMLMCN